MGHCDIEIDPAGLEPVGAALVDASAQFSAGAEALRGLGECLDPGGYPDLGLVGLAGGGEASLGPSLTIASQAWHRTALRLADSAVELSTAVALTTALYAEADSGTAADLGSTGG